MTERSVVDGAFQRLEGRLAFGQHAAEFFAADDGNVEDAITIKPQEIRVIFDGLLRDTRLEELHCADGTYSRIPDDTTVEEIANCIGPRDSLVNCTKVCLDPTPGNLPLGVLDQDDDGVPDIRRMIDHNPDPTIVELGASIICDGTPVPLDQRTSFWTSEGSQTFPQGNDGFRGLGPGLRDVLGGEVVETSISWTTAGS